MNGRNKGEKGVYFWCLNKHLQVLLDTHLISELPFPRFLFPYPWLGKAIHLPTCPPSFFFSLAVPITALKAMLDGMGRKAFLVFFPKTFFKGEKLSLFFLHVTTLSLKDSFWLQGCC